MTPTTTSQPDPYVQLDALAIALGREPFTVFLVRFLGPVWPQYRCLSNSYATNAIVVSHVLSVEVALTSSGSPVFSFGVRFLVPATRFLHEPRCSHVGGLSPPVVIVTESS